MKDADDEPASFWWALFFQQSVGIWAYNLSIRLRTVKPAAPGAITLSPLALREVLFLKENKDHECSSNSTFSFIGKRSRNTKRIQRFGNAGI